MRHREKTIYLKRAAAAALAMAIFAVPAPASAQAKPTSSKAKPTSSDPYTVRRTSIVSGSAAFAPGCMPQFAENGAAENGAQIAADPTDPRHLVVSYMLDAGHAAVGASSHDGGRSWTRTVVPGLGRCGGGASGSRIGDPYLAIGRDGVVYASTSTGTDDKGSVGSDASNVVMSASYDGGRSFGDPPVPVQTTFSDQRGQLLTDPTRDETVTVLEEHLIGVGGVNPLPTGTGNTAYTSTDGGRNFDDGVHVPKLDPTAVTVTAGLERSGTDVVAFASEVAPRDIALYLPGYVRRDVFGDAPPEQHIVASRSTDGGQTFETPTEVGIMYPGEGACCLADTSAGPDGTLFATWSDGDNEPTLMRSGDPTLMRSGDGGDSWDALTGPPARGVAAQPSLAVARNGDLGLFYYDVSGNDVTPRLATSDDNGTTWTQLDLGPPFDEQEIYALGPYQGIVAVPHGFAIAFATGGPLATGLGEKDIAFVRVERPRR